jgi:hypothetical protein
MCNPITTKYPDALLAKGEHLGFEWEVTNNGIGYRCGYVRVPLGHPWHGKDYNDIDVEVHGGLTFAEMDADCHKGGEDNAYWVGFDCGHYGDGRDYSLTWGRYGDGEAAKATERAFEQQFKGCVGTVRSTEYVADECRSLCEQAARAAR